MPAASLPIFHGGKILANISIQRAKTEEALQTYQQTVLAALEDAQNSLNSYANGLDRVDGLQKSFDASSRALELSQELYKEGLIDFLHVLDSERTVFTAEDALIQGKQAVSASAIAAYKAFAGSVSPEDTTTDSH